MDNLEIKYCRLCLGVISNENFEKISDIAEEILEILLLKLDLDKSKHVMCEVCALKVMEALKFKSMCLDTDNTIIPYVDVETGRSVDLLEIYAEENGDEELIDTSFYHKVCRLCMQLIKGEFISIREGEIDAIEQYIPEMIITVIEDPVICRECFDSVDTHRSFLRNCLEVEEKIKSELTIEALTRGDQYEIKTECAEVKSE